MPTLEQMIRQLHGQRRKIQREIDRIDQAISALQKVGRTDESRGGRRPKRTMSASARRKIAQAQKARWAKLKAKAG